VSLDAKASRKEKGRHIDMPEVGALIDGPKLGKKRNFLERMVETGGPSARG